jgi:5-methylcytosine-specific restriction endonuclease McrA
MGSKISKNKRVKVWWKYGGKCAYCGIDVEFGKMHVDHIIPKQRGFTQHEAIKYGITKGGDNLDNLNPSCASCNISKSTFSIDKWRIELALKVDRLRRDVTNFRILERFGVVKETKEPIVFYFEKGGKNG